VVARVEAARVVTVVAARVVAVVAARVVTEEAREVVVREDLVKECQQLKLSKLKARRPSLVL